ncbi:hypothetical protein [Sphaerisporangium album]|uniref:hypothetical protein n=1 Tax=Sphaerisporangium album TaxID=509200 RepID=UPI0011C02FC1|nr:hypothetical protein [Sphaerisporangium album]
MAYLDQLEIVWVRSAKVAAYRYGMVGEVRAFILDVTPRPYELRCILPGPKGEQFIQRLPSEEDAHERAREMLAQFMRRLASPSSGNGGPSPAP